MSFRLAEAHQDLGYRDRLDLVYQDRLDHLD